MNCRGRPLKPPTEGRSPLYSPWAAGDVAGAGGELVGEEWGVGRGATCSLGTRGKSYDSAPELEGPEPLVNYAVHRIL